MNVYQGETDGTDALKEDWWLKSGACDVPLDIQFVGWGPLLLQDHGSWVVLMQSREVDWSGAGLLERHPAPS